MLLRTYVCTFWRAYERRGESQANMRNFVFWQLNKMKHRTKSGAYSNVKCLFAALASWAAARGVGANSSGGLAFVQTSITTPVPRGTGLAQGNKSVYTESMK